MFKISVGLILFSLTSAWGMEGIEEVAQEQSLMTLLPTEMKLEIFKWVDLPELGIGKRVCREWNNLLEDLWPPRILHFYHYGLQSLDLFNTQLETILQDSNAPLPEESLETILKQSQNMWQFLLYDPKFYQSLEENHRRAFYAHQDKLLPLLTTLKDVLWPTLSGGDPQQDFQIYTKLNLYLSTSFTVGHSPLVQLQEVLQRTHMDAFLTAHAAEEPLLQRVVTAWRSSITDLQILQTPLRSSQEVSVTPQLLEVGGES